MTRWHWAVALTVAAGTTAAAQTRFTSKPGYVAVRVNVGGTGPATGDGGPLGPDGFPLPGPEEIIPPGPDGFSPDGSAPAKVADFSKSVLTVIPVERIQDRLFYPRDRKSRLNPLHPTAWTPYGQTLLFADDATVQLYPIPGSTLQEDIETRYKKNVKTLDGLLDVADDALAAGLTDLAVKYAGELVEVAKTAPADKVSDRVRGVVAVLTDLLPALDKDVPADRMADRWRERFMAAGVEQSPHYAVVHFGDRSSVSPTAVRDRLDMLEQNLKGFYLWHAFAGRKLPLPAAKLTVVIADDPAKMRPIKDALDGHPIVSDAFYAPAYNVVVLSPARLDDAGRTFDRFVDGLYRAGWNRADLLTGNIPPLDKSHPETLLEQAIDITRASTIALADRRVEYETVLAEVSREGTRQLYAAAGLLAPHVRYPEWVETGSVDLFHKPKGPIVTDANDNPPPGTRPGSRPGTSAGATTPPELVMTVNLHFGHGAPNYVLHRLYRQMAGKKELNPNAAEMLKNTLTDAYFDAARQGEEADPPPPGPDRSIDLTSRRPAFGFNGPPGFRPPPGTPIEDVGLVPPTGVFPSIGGTIRDPAAEADALKKRLSAKSQLTAWALVYYLANQKLDKLVEFYAALGRMPRDMTLDRNAVLLTFVRTFGLATADGKAVDEAKFSVFADAWVEYMRSVHPVGVDVSVTAFAKPDTGGEGNPGAVP